MTYHMKTTLKAIMLKVCFLSLQLKMSYWTK
jgi:hypothetical protein